MTENTYYFKSITQKEIFNRIVLLKIKIETEEQHYDYMLQDSDNPFQFWELTKVVKLIKELEKELKTLQEHKDKHLRINAANVIRRAYLKRFYAPPYKYPNTIGGTGFYKAQISFNTFY
jgi:hypothetical protein